MDAGESFALELLLFDLESFFQECLFFPNVASLQTSRHTCTGVSAGVHDMPPVVMLGLVQQGLNSWLHKRPCASIERLLLTPNDGLRVRVSIQVVSQVCPREGVELFNPGDRGILVPVVGTVLVYCGVCLSSAHDNAVNLFRLNDGLTVLWIWDNPLKVRVAGEVLDAGTRKRVSQE